MDKIFFFCGYLFWISGIMVCFIVLFGWGRRVSVWVLQRVGTVFEEAEIFIFAMYFVFYFSRSRLLIVSFPGSKRFSIFRKILFCLHKQIFWNLFRIEC